MRPLADRWQRRFNYISGDAENRLGLRAILIRPDGMVASAIESAADDQGVRQAAERWFGEPDGPPS
ncbi:hypothetical protein [Afipia felis]|uniref:aromatic-ring hydroxylase C-terminal domain-containing protein n=1 Tax=Afipia felis TaxID=1035 RepID=UPI0032DE3492